MLRHPDLVRRLGDLWSAERDVEELRRRNPGAVISSDAVFEGWREGSVALAPRSQIERGTIVALGDRLNGYGSFIVGCDSWIGPYNNFRLAGQTTIRIGDGCLISQFCTLVSANHDLSRRTRMRDAPSSMAKRDVTLGDDVWLGAGAIVLPGVTIANGAVVAAGSVVTSSIGEYAIHAGNPARKIGERPQ